MATGHLLPFPKYDNRETLTRLPLSSDGIYLFLRVLQTNQLFNLSKLLHAKIVIVIVNKYMFVARKKSSQSAACLGHVPARMRAVA
jgi:hypothetical protein